MPDLNNRKPMDLRRRGIYLLPNLVNDKVCYTTVRLVLPTNYQLPADFASN